MISNDQKNINTLSNPYQQLHQAETQIVTQNVQPEIREFKKPKADKMMACRNELKYVISPAMAKSMMGYVSMFLDLDRYSKLQPGAFYPITSLYIDSDDLHLCWESIDGRKNRFKLRVRGYSDDPDSPCFFEIKRRINTMILKSRARVMHQHVKPLLDGFWFPDNKYETDFKALRQFQLYMKTINAKPKVMIKYLRKAYEGTGDNRVRITFDHSLCFNTYVKPKVMLNGPGWQKFDVGGVILEIKFTGRYPAWLGRMVEYYNLRSQSMSKYANSIKSACSLRYCAPQLPIWGKANAMDR